MPIAWMYLSGIVSGCGCVGANSVRGRNRNCRRVICNITNLTMITVPETRCQLGKVLLNGV